LDLETKFHATLFTVTIWVQIPRSRTARPSRS